MTRDEIVSRVKGFIQETFLYMRPDFELRGDNSLLGTGVIDSMGMMEMIDFVQQEFSIEVGDADITEENLGTLDAIADYVSSRVEKPSRQIA